MIIDELWLVAPAYLPLGVVGGWRWGVWLVKRIMAALYRPDTGQYEANVSVVTPVYNEDPVLFRRALESWRDNGVAEIVAVIDYTDGKCIEVFKQFGQVFAGARLIVTTKPGKRPALADGIRAARSEIVALVDSDTLWDKNLREECLRPFRNPRVGGVTMRQQVLTVRTMVQRLFNGQQSLRFLDEYPFLTAIDGSTVHCLSGRTALYRRFILLPLLDNLVNETFWGKPVISGDDKWLTYLIEARGWRVAYQRNVSVYTPGEEKMLAYLKQRLRWTRNSWRADLRALGQGWTWRKPYFALYLIDRAVQPFTLLLGPIYFVTSIILGLWVPAVTLFLWWHVSRLIRLWPHLKQRPQDVVIVPAYIFMGYVLGLLRIYALFTLNRQGWITRWDKSRLAQLNWLRLAPGYVATALVVLILTGVVFVYKGETLQSQTVTTYRLEFGPVARNAALD